MLRLILGLIGTAGAGIGAMDHFGAFHLPDGASLGSGGLGVLVLVMLVWDVIGVIAKVVGFLVLGALVGFALLHTGVISTISPW